MTKTLLQRLLPRAFTRLLALPIVGPVLDEFSQWMGQQGYPISTTKGYLERAHILDRWLRRRGKRTIAELTDQDLIAAQAAFRPYSHDACVTRALRIFLCANRTIPVVHAHERSFAERERFAFGAYLEKVRGFAVATVTRHRQQLRFFLEFLQVDQCPSAIRNLRLEQIEDFIRLSAKNNNRFSLQQIVATVRTYLQWKHAKGCLRRPLHEQVDTPRCYRQERLPKAWPWKQVAALLRSIDRSTAHGRRDFTLLYLMIRYGLRSNEVVRLTLDDIDWRAATLRIVQTKTKQALLLPLTDESGDILASYLRHGRPENARRELFLRMRAPVAPLKPASVGDLLEARILRSNVALRPCGTHVLRHSMAVHLLRQGVSTKSIGDTLGHRDVESTAVYLRLAIDDLRGIGLPLPRPGRPADLAPVDWRQAVPKARACVAAAFRLQHFQSPFASALNRYLTARRALGRRFNNEERILRRWDDFLFRHRLGVRDFDATALQRWSDELAYLTQNVCRNHLRVVRNFLLFHHRDHPKTWIPDPIFFPRTMPHASPRLITTEEMARVLATARHLPPTLLNPLRAETIHLGLALLFCCGLRRGELLRLRLAHYDTHERLLRIERTKFYKSRLVPLHKSVARELERYLSMRRRHGLPIDLQSPLIWSGRPESLLTGLSPQALLQVWRHLCVSAGLLDARRRPPALHHLRHSMAVTALRRCYDDGKDPGSKLPHLAAYLGHVSPVYTHHYLHLTPDLRQIANRRFHKLCAALFEKGGRP